MPYEFFDDLTFADVAFEATGKDIEEMFISAAKATTNSMIDDLAKIMIKKTVKIKVEADNVERLLFDFLQEIIFLKDAKQLLFRDYEVIIEKKNNKLILSGVVKGEKLNIKKHNLIVDVKAVSWHRFEVKEKEGRWKAFVILDV